MEPEPIQCPNCGSRARAWGEKNNHRLLQCAACRLIFVSPTPAPSIYGEEYFSGAAHGFGYVDYDRDKEPMIPTFGKYLDLFAQYGGPSGKLFDVGAATGFFLDIARQRGYEVSGIEISDYAARIARGKGIDVATGVLGQRQIPADAFDIVTLLDVIEHMTDPFSEIDELTRILRPGGMLVVNTPDGESLLAKVLKRNWHLVVPPEHLFYFSQRNLGDLLEKRGYRILYSSRIGKQFTFAYIFKMLHKWQKLSIWDKLARFFSRGRRASWSIPINLHDNFFLIAKKPVR